MRATWQRHRHLLLFVASIGALTGCTKSDVSSPTPPQDQTASLESASTPQPAPIATAPVSEPISENQPTPRSEESTPVPPAPPKNLIVNGSFEEGPDPGQWREIDVGPIGVRGWVVTGKIDVIGTFWKAAHGNRSLDLNGPANAGPGGLKQTISTQPGKTYYVVFSLAGNLFAGPAVKGLEVRAAGQSKSFSFDTTGRGGNDMGWAVQSWEFKADTAESTLEFISTVTEKGGAGPALDHVWVSEVKPPDDVYNKMSERVVAVAAPVTPQPAPVVSEKKPDVTTPKVAPEEKDGDPRDLDVTYIERTPRYDYDAPKNNPEPGDKVTFRGHIRAWGPPPKNAEYRWELDGQLIAKGTLDNLQTGEDRVLTQDWVWGKGPHTIALIVDPDNKVVERSEVNNRIVDRTDGLSVGFWVEESLLAYFHEHQHNLDLGTNSWEDWAQRHIRAWNDACADAIWPLTPQGVLDRVRLDKITIVPDGSLPLHGGLPSNHPDRTDKSVDLMWGFPAGSRKEFDNYASRKDGPFRYAGGLVHELGHARYLVDHYLQDVGEKGVRVKENGKLIPGTEFMEYMAFNGVHYNQHGGIMTGPYADYRGPWSPAEAFALNRIAGKRAEKGNYNAPGNLGEFMRDIPERTLLRVVEGSNAHPAADAKVRVYLQKQVPEYANRVFVDPAEFEFKTDSQGEVELPKDLFEHSEKKLALLRIDVKGSITYRFLDILDVNMEHWRGHKKEGRITFEVWPPGAPPLLEVWGFDRQIANGDETPEAADHTDFGAVLIGSERLYEVAGAGKRRVFLLKNRGPKKLVLKEYPFVKITGANADEFEIVLGNNEKHIYRFSMLGVTVHFRPKALGPRKAFVEIASDDPKTPLYRFAIGGEGIAK